MTGTRRAFPSSRTWRLATSSMGPWADWGRPVIARSRSLIQRATELAVEILSSVTLILIQATSRSMSNSHAGKYAVLGEEDTVEELWIDAFTP
jgi:hypothetical protein